MNLRKDHYWMFEVGWAGLNGHVLATSIHLIHLCTYCRALKKALVHAEVSIRVLCFTNSMNVLNVILLGLDWPFKLLYNFQQRISWLSHRWRTQRNAISNVNCRIQWIIESLNAPCALWYSEGHACLSVIKFSTSKALSFWSLDVKVCWRFKCSAPLKCISGPICVQP